MRQEKEKLAGDLGLKPRGICVLRVTGLFGMGLWANGHFRYGRWPMGLDGWVWDWEGGLVQRTARPE